MIMKKMIAVTLSILMLSAITGCVRGSVIDNDYILNTSEIIMEETTETPTTEMATPQMPTTEVPTTEVPTTEAYVPTIEDEVDAILNEMSLHEKVCMMFVVTPGSIVDGQTITSVDDTYKNVFAEYPVGGMIFFAGNLVDREQTKSLLGTLQTYSIEISGLPLFACVDEEGGRVARIGNNPNFGVTKIQAMSNVTTAVDAYNAGWIIGDYLSELGFNFDFAPDADVITNPANTVIGDRSFGTDGEIVSSLAVEYAKGLQENKVLSTFKHYPGHGATEGDTHEGYAYTSKSLLELMEAELKPFIAAKENNVDAIMVAHISVPGILGDNTPCTMSKYMVTDVLRNEIGYEGLIITDALNMGAIVNEYSADEAAVKAILAGNDLLLMPDDFYAAYNGVINAVNNGVITEDRLNESVRRIIKSKILLKM